MSWLFTVENKVVKPNPETLLIPAFREIWERDRDPGKFKAMDEFAYVEFMVSVKESNPYSGYNELERKKRICKDIMGHEEYEPDDTMLVAMEWLKKHQIESSPSMRFYLSALFAAEKLENFFNTFSMTEVNPKTGNPLYKPKDITSALIDTENALQKLANIKSKVQNEIFESVKTKGQKVVSPFADPSSL